MEMPGRKYSAAGGYRYGFNGKEQDKDISSLTAYDYGFRIYNPALGRFLSVDPLTKRYPQLTPYQFASNTPITFIDIDGLESGAPPQPGGNNRSVLVQMDAKKLTYSLLAAKYGHSPEERADYHVYLQGVDTRNIEEGKAFGKALLITGAIVGAIAIDMFVTKGWLTKTVIGYEIISAFPHNSAKTPEGRAEQQREMKEHLTNAFLWWAGGEFGKAVAPVAKYMSGSFIIGSKTLARVTSHLEELGFANDAGNEIMIERMKKIVTGEMKTTEIDVNFAKHELREAELVKGGMTYEEAHHAVLKEQGMGNMNVSEYQKKLYTQEALDASDGQWEKEVKKK